MQADDGVRRATIFTLDPASPRRGAGTKDGAPVLEMTENPPYAVGTAILPADLKVNPYTNFEIEATIAGTGGAMFGVRLVPVTRKKEKLHPMHAGMWGKAAPETFTTLTGRFRMAEDPDVAGEVPDVASLQRALGSVRGVAGVLGCHRR